jgi:hypothetical protein
MTLIVVKLSLWIRVWAQDSDPERHKRSTIKNKLQKFRVFKELDVLLREL